MWWYMSRNDTRCTELMTALGHVDYALCFMQMYLGNAQADFTLQKVVSSFADLVECSTVAADCMLIELFRVLYLEACSPSARRLGSLLGNAISCNLHLAKQLLHRIFVLLNKRWASL